MAKCWSICIWAHWNVAVKFYQLPLTINARPNQEVTIINIIVFKKSLN